MNKTRWLAALLIASWTLNVALIVAYFLKTTYPPGARFYDKPGFERHVEGLPGIPPESRMMFHREASPMHDRYALLIREMSAEFATDELDTARLLLLSDSLTVVRGELQKKLIQHLTEMHGELSSEDRHRLSRRMITMIDGQRQRMGVHRPDRERPRFKPNSVNKSKSNNFNGGKK